MATVPRTSDDELMFSTPLTTVILVQYPRSRCLILLLSSLSHSAFQALISLTAFSRP